ncbi:MAG: hypothetical protein IJH47_04310 [Oscillospiraceae bacterium]|nr:hypothetical protein [Oscillospiraceae bacterium]
MGNKDINILHLIQGDQYAIPFPVYIGSELATPDNVTGVRIKINDDLKEYPDGELLFDADRGVWCWPITEEQTRTWPMRRLPAQVGVNLGGGDYRYCPTFYVELGPNIIGEAWE